MKIKEKIEKMLDWYEDNATAPIDEGVGVVFWWAIICIVLFAVVMGLLEKLGF